MIGYAKAAAIAGVGAMLLATGCGPSSKPDVATAAARSDASAVAVVAGENEYGNVASQIGGPYVSVYSVDSNPNTDPHTYEATPSVGRKIARAKLLIENGVGYDSFMNRLASASPNSVAQGDQRATSAGSAGQHTEPTPVVRPENHAGRRPGVGV